MDHRTGVDLSSGLLLIAYRLGSVYTRNGVYYDEIRPES